MMSSRYSASIYSRPTRHKTVQMETNSREKKPFSSCIQGIREDQLKRPLCHDVYGDLNFQPELEWVVSRLTERHSLQTRPFGETLGLSEDEVRSAIHVAPRSKEQQLRQAIFAWSKRESNEATLEKLLEALYIGDEVELVESICQSLLPNNISDERKVDPPEEVSLLNQIKIETVPHKAVQEEEVVSPSSFESENGPFVKPVRVSSSGSNMPHLQRAPSDQDVIKPVSATEHGRSHAAMAWSTQQVIPSHLLHDKKPQVSLKGGAGSNSIQVEDGALEKSLTYQGETTSPNMLLEARMSRLEREVIEIREESRKGDAKLRQEIEELKRELLQKDSEISQLRKELDMEMEQKQNAERQLVLERQQTEASNEELQRKLEELNQQLQEKCDQIEKLKRKKSMRVELDQVDHDGGGGDDNGEDDTSCIYSEEDTSVVTNWKFEESKILGCGNFGIVFKGHCQDTGRELAVKVVRDLNDKTINSLELEYNMLSALRHKRIVSYLGVCYKPHPTHGEECLFIMTEFMPGGSLANFYEDKGPLNETLTRRYTRQILQGVEYLHQLDIIHRDIKGSNIMRNTRGYVKLADFGSAKKIFAETSDKNKSSYLYGTAPWAAPEVLRGESAQRQSDVWSVAATVVEMITAEWPYKSDPGIKDKRTIVYLVGKNKLDPLQSASVKGLISSGSLTQDAVHFLTECFKSAPEDRPSAVDLLQTFNFCRKDCNS